MVTEWFLIAILTPVEVLTSIPCPSWEDAYYINRKCFKPVFHKNQHLVDWYAAEDNCVLEQGAERLAELRTLGEAELALSLGINREVWIGAIDEMGTGLRYPSDNLTADFFDFYTIIFRSTPLAPPTCAHTLDVLHFSEASCEETRQGQFCEKAVSETYVISSFIANGVFMDVVASTDTNETQQLLVIYRSLDVTDPTFDLIDIAATSPVFTYHFLNTSIEDLNPIQTTCVEVVTSHPMTLTLWFSDDDSAITRFRLHPFLEDLGRENISPWYFIATTSLDVEHFRLSIVSRHPEITDVSVVFNRDPTSSDYIWVESMLVVNPKSVKSSLPQYHTLNVNGTLGLDGTDVTASWEVAVYVILVVHTSYNSTYPSLINAYQAFPSQIVYVEYYTIPSYSTQRLGEDVYKVVNLQRHTNITINGNDYYMDKRGSTLNLIIPSNESFFISGDRRFLLYRVFNGSYSADNENDTCATDITRPDQWLSEYILPTSWMSNASMLTIHIIIDNDKTKSVYLDDARIDLTCNNVTGSDIYVACLYNLPIPFEFIPAYLTIKAWPTFGAYLVWVSGAKLGCQNLGLNWYGNWKITTANTQTATTTTAATTTITTVESTTIAATGTTKKTTATTTTDAQSTTSVTDTSSWPYSSSTGWSTITPTPTPSPESTKHLDNMTCYGIGLVKRTNLTSQEVEEIVDTIQRALQVDVTKTSSFVRSKTSADDHRPTSTGLGYGGIAFVVILLAGVVISDVITFLCRPSRLQGRNFHKHLKEKEKKNVLSVK